MVREKSDFSSYMPLAARRSYIRSLVEEGQDLSGKKIIDLLAARFSCTPENIERDILLLSSDRNQESFEKIVKMKWRGCCKRSEIIGVHNDLDWDSFLELFKKSDKKCCYCQRELICAALLVADHVIPLAKGGSNHISNIVLSCAECNTKKGDRIFP